MIVGIDIGGTNFRIGALDKKDEIHNFKKIYVKDVLTNDDVLFDIKTIIKNNFNNIKIDAISIGVPGTLDVNRQTIVQVPNVIGMDNLNIVDYLSKEFNVPVYIEKDVNMLINYDLYKYNIDTKGVVVAFYFGTGIGNAIMIDGKIYIGKDGAAGEVGHIPVDGNKEICGCGNIGCAESVAGGKYLSKLCSEVFTGTDIVNIFSYHNDSHEIKQFVDRMSQTLATEINILNPNRIIIGGGVINMKDFPIELFMDRLREHTRKPYPLNSLDITFAKDDDKAGVVGACLYAKKQIKSN